MAAKTYAVLLRGINVGRQEQAADARARARCSRTPGTTTSRRTSRAATSCFRSSLAESALTRGESRSRSPRSFSLAIRVLVRTHAELERIAGANPFLAGGGEATGMHVVFLDRAPKARSDRDARPGSLAGRRVQRRRPRDLPQLPERRRPDEADARLPRAAARRHRARAQLEHAAQAGRADGTRSERLSPPTRSETCSKPSRWSRLAAIDDR